MSTWMFKYTLKLAQDSCSHYTADTKSRGHKKHIGGCPSCKYRTPSNEATAKAENS